MNAIAAGGAEKGTFPFLDRTRCETRIRFLQQRRVWSQKLRRDHQRMKQAP